MLFEDILILLMGGSAVYFIGIPLFKIIKTISNAKRDPLKEAKERLEQAKLEAEAAKLNKEVETLYDNMYKDTIEENEEENKKDKRRL